MSKFSCEVARGSAHSRDSGLELQSHYRQRVLVIVHNLGSGFTHSLRPCARSCLCSISGLTYQLSIAARPTDRTFNTAINRSISKLCRFKLGLLLLTHSRCRFSLHYPPEIRNKVYGYLFKREDSVLLHNADAFHLPCRDLEDYHTGLQQYYDACEAEIGTDEEFWPDLHQGLGLLLSCRQVYQEASGILYGGNTFVFSRILTRHDYRIGTIHKHQEYLQVNYAGQWLTIIGPQTIWPPC